MTIGLDKPVIVLTTGLVELLDEEELRFVVGHELGHAFSGHSVYRTMLLWLMNLSGAVAWLPGGSSASRRWSPRCSNGSARLSCPATGLACWSGRTSRPRCARR